MRDAGLEVETLRARPGDRRAVAVHPARARRVVGSAHARRHLRQPVRRRPARRVSRSASGPTPRCPTAGSPVRLRTAALNHHDVWSLRGVGLPADRLPMVLGCDGAGVDPDGNEVLVHAVVASPGWTGDETLDPRRSLLSARSTTAPSPRSSPCRAATSCPSPRGCRGSTRPACPRPGSRPTGCSSRTPACSRARPCSSRARRAGSRRRSSSSGRRPASGCGSRAATRPRASRRWRSAPTGRSRAGPGCPSGSTPSWRPWGRRPGRTRSTACGRAGTVVISGATSGDAPAKAELTKIFFKQLRVVGSTMGTRDELERLARFVVDAGIEPLVDSVLPLAQARDGFERMVRRAGRRQGRLHRLTRRCGTRHRVRAGRLPTGNVESRPPVHPRSRRERDVRRAVGDPARPRVLLRRQRVRAGAALHPRPPRVAAAVGAPRRPARRRPPRHRARPVRPRGVREADGRLLARGARRDAARPARPARHRAR